MYRRRGITTACDDNETQYSSVNQEEEEEEDDDEDDDAVSNVEEDESDDDLFYDSDSEDLVASNKVITPTGLARNKPQHKFRRQWLILKLLVIRRMCKFPSTMGRRTQQSHATTSGCFRNHQR